MRPKVGRKFAGALACAVAIELPGPAPRPYTASRASSLGVTCSECHEEIVREWEASLHRQAYTNPYFQRALRIESTRFCRKCHATDSDPNSEPTLWAERSGVSCLACHLTRLGIVGSRGRTKKGVSEASPHEMPNELLRVRQVHEQDVLPSASATRRLEGTDAPLHWATGDARWATAEACAGCHQFDFPVVGASAERTPMQDTVREHAASKYANMPCQSCHMPLIRGANGELHRDHRFAVQADPKILARAVRVELESRNETVVRVAFVPGMIGHALPTGDLFRRVELRLWALTPNGKSRVRASYALERIYRQDRAASTRQIEKDSRLEPATAKGDGRRVVELSFPSASGPIHWQLVWQRMPAGAGNAVGMNAADQEREILSGVW